MGCLVTCGCCAARALRPKGGAPSAQDTRRAMQSARQHSHNQLVVVRAFSAVSSSGWCLVLATLVAEKEKVIKRLSLSLSAEKSKTKLEKVINATAELMRTHKLQHEEMDRKQKEDMTDAEKKHEKEIRAMEKHHSM